MNKYGNFQTNWASAPGDTIADVLKARKISLPVFAEQMNSTVENVKYLIHGYILISEEIAKSLESVLGATAEFWLTRETQYRESIARLKIKEETKWMSELPVKDMINNGWIDKSSEVIKSCLAFFDVPDVWTWRRKYGEVLSLTAFRKSSVIKSHPTSTAAWLRQAEIKAQQMNCKKWDRQLFESKLLQIRKLSRKRYPKTFIPELQEICAECGVALVVLRTPDGCSASGAAKFIKTDKAMIVVSFRYLSDDHFWFTFFHEAGHLVLHGDKLFIDEEVNQETEEEKEANNFAEEMLIPKILQQRLATMQINETQIKNMAKDADVSLGIVVGQLQFLGRISQRYFNTYKKRYSLDDIRQLSH